MNHALADKSNNTKFTLLFSNVSEKDILLREEFDSLAKKFPDTLKVVYYVDKGEKDWKGNMLPFIHHKILPKQSYSGETGYISKEGIKKYVSGPDAGDKLKIFICGKSILKAAPEAILMGVKARLDKSHL